MIKEECYTRTGQFENTESTIKSSVFRIFYVASWFFM